MGADDHTIDIWRLNDVLTEVARQGDRRADVERHPRFRFSRGATLLRRAALTSRGRTLVSFDREGRLVVFMAAAQVLPVVAASFM